jgi:NAD(P)-dependent dehydrogenase (short-subunit alcohol dehydrogenase family)
VLGDINEEVLNTDTDALISAGPQAIGITCDVSNEAQVAAMIARAVASLGRLGSTTPAFGSRRATQPMRLPIGRKQRLD